MAQLIRYFGVTAAGAGDGTSYANRAALFSAGNWSTIITGTNFNNDSLICYIDSGTYTCSQSLASSLFANPPTNNRQISFIAAPNGTVWVPPNPAWSSAQPQWSTANMPLIQCSSSSIAIFGLSLRVMCYGLRLEGQNSNGSSGAIAFLGPSSFAWCIFENTTSNSNAQAVHRCFCVFTNCVFRMTGTSYQSAIFSIGDVMRFFNCRVEGNPAASSGNRFGINQTSGGGEQILAQNLCVHGFITPAEISAAVVSVQGYIQRSVFVGRGSAVVYNHSGVIASPTARHIFRTSIFANGTTGLVMNDTPGHIEECSFIDCSGTFTSDYDVHAIGNSSYSTMANYFVDPSNADYTQRDFRIKSGSALHGIGVGISDQAAGGLSFSGGFQN